MHLGIIKINNTKIYIDKHKNLISYYYENGNKKIINNDLIILLIKELVTCHHKKFLYQDEYEVYLDEQTGYKHFYKDGKENYTIFFYENGYDAILYKENSNQSNFKTFTVKGTKICISIILLLTVINGIKSNIVQNPEKIVSPQIEYTQENELTVDSSFFKDFILNSENLTKEEKQLLINNQFFKDLSETPITSSRKSSLEEKFNNITIKTGTEGRPSPNVLGWYIDLFPNTIHVVDENDNNTKIHEFIHLTQEFTEYSYIREACADLISLEYYGIEDSLTYNDAATRIQFLMELIGPEIIWNLNFNGDETSFENKIYELLPEESAIKLLQLFKQNPANITVEKHQEQNKEIDKYLYQIYNTLTNENNPLNTIQEETGITFDTFNSNQTYFNHSNNEYSFSFSKIITLEEAKQKGLVNISVAEKTYISEENIEKLKSQEIPIFKEYEILNNNFQIMPSVDKNQEIIDMVYNINNDETYTLEEAEQKGYIECKYWYYKYIPANENTVSEYPLIITPTEKYEGLEIKEIYAFEPGYEEGNHNILITYVVSKPLINNQIKNK